MEGKTEQGTSSGCSAEAMGTLGMSWRNNCREESVTVQGQKSLGWSHVQILGIPSKELSKMPKVGRQGRGLLKGRGNTLGKHRGPSLLLSCAGFLLSSLGRAGVDWHLD